MKAFTFQAPPNILFEPGASRKIAEIVGSYSVRRVLLVSQLQCGRLSSMERSITALYRDDDPSQGRGVGNA
jgi:alcohol dehydrogenase class IV